LVVEVEEEGSEGKRKVGGAPAEERGVREVGK
jgi:hypothetical protein